MVDTSLLVLLALLYVATLFAVAWRADRRKHWLQRLRPLIYSLALAVYCSSWTFFGAVGEAVDNNWNYLLIYLGPALLFLLGIRFLKKLATVGERHKITSIADFIGSRYGKSQWLSALVTLLAIVGSLPYIALQLRAVAMVWDVLQEGGQAQSFNVDTALVTALLMSAFAMLFGTRHLEGRERNRGMMAAIAMESAVKLVAFAAVSIAAVWWLWGNVSATELTQLWTTEWLHTPPDWDSFAIQALLATLAILCLPRQFHMAVVEFQSERDLQLARWVFPTYLLLFALLILPLALAGNFLLPGEVSADSLALTLPLMQGQPTLALLAFLGGISAATGMVVVASVTLAVMISNELVAPLWLRFTPGKVLAVTSLGNHLRLIRCIGIVVLLLLSWIVHRTIAGMGGLAAIGLLSFAAAAQLAPALIAALYWRRAHRYGVLAGLIAGYGLWFFCLVLPELYPTHAVVDAGLWGISWLRPQSLMGLETLDPLSHGVFWSLLCNAGLFTGVSLCCRHSASDLAQATSFIDTSPARQAGGEDIEPTQVPMGQIRSLLEPLVGRQRLDNLWGDFERRLGQRLLADDAAPRFVVEDVQARLAGIMGAATAERAVELLHKDRPLAPDDFAGLIDSTSRQLHLNQSLHANKTRFLAHTSHDLLQPINAARLFTAAMEQKIKQRDYTTLPDDIKHIDNALASAEELVAALREISRLDAGDLTPECEHFPVDELLNSLVQEFSAQARQRNLKLRHQPCSLWVYSDRHLLRRILQNFLSNALRYTRHGSVLIGCRRRSSNKNGGKLEIQVWDTGPGIAGPAQQKIFAEFVRLSPGQDIADKGLGLGLAVAKRSADLLRHRIKLLSSAGRGAMFSITLPQGKPLPPPVKTAPERLTVGDLCGVKVLCIDNDPSVLDAMQRLLSDWGCEVTVAASLAQVLAQVNSQAQPGIVIADYHLDHGENGIKVLDALREKLGNSDFTGILASADVSDTLREAARQKGYYYLAKPIKPAALRSVIRRFALGVRPAVKSGRVAPAPGD